MANNFNPWNQDSVEVKQEPDLESTEIKSEITEKSLVNQDFIEAVEVKQESELDCTEMYQCDLCPVFFNSEGDLTKHKSKGHRCEFCAYTFHSVEAKLNHMRKLVFYS